MVGVSFEKVVFPLVKSESRDPPGQKSPRRTGLAFCVLQANNLSERRSYERKKRFIFMESQHFSSASDEAADKEFVAGCCSPAAEELLMFPSSD